MNRQALVKLISVGMAVHVLSGCASDARLSAELTNDELGAALVREFEFGSSRASVVARAEQLGLARVPLARVVDGEGKDVTLEVSGSTQMNFNERGWRVVEMPPNESDPVSFQFASRKPSDGHARAMAFMFSPDNRLTRIAVSPQPGPVDSQPGFAIDAEDKQ